jgi:hypothetical protein
MRIYITHFACPRFLCIYTWGNLLQNNGGSYWFLANPHNHQSSAEAEPLETLSQE